MARLVSHRWYEAAGDRIDEFSNHIWTLFEMSPPSRQWDLMELIQNPAIKTEDILNEFKFECFTDECRNKLYDSLSKNPNITLKDFRDNPKLYCGYLFNCLDIYANNFCNISEMERELCKSYLKDPKCLGDLILKYPNASWHWYYISSDPTITWKFIKDHPELFWDWDGVSLNDNITWDLVKAHPDIPWSWLTLSQHPNITWDIIASNPQIPWDWFGVSCNPNITWDIITSNPQIPWDWMGISRNQNMTWRIIESHPNKPWNWARISSNTFNKKCVSLQKPDNPNEVDSLFAALYERNQNLFLEILP